MTDKTLYILAYPPDTREVIAQTHRFTLSVICPHCGATHYHNKASAYMSYVRAHCKKGYYIIHLGVDLGGTTNDGQSREHSDR